MRPAPLARPIVGLFIIPAKLIFRYNNNVILAHINIKGYIFGQFRPSPHFQEAISSPLFRNINTLDNWRTHFRLICYII